MPKTGAEIYEVIGRFIRTFGGDGESWYIGTVGKPREIILTKHNINEYADIFICLPAKDSNQARKAKQRLMEAFGSNGEFADIPQGADYVYAYLKN